MITGKAQPRCWWYRGVLFWEGRTGGGGGRGARCVARGVGPDTCVCCLASSPPTPHPPLTPTAARSLVSASLQVVYSGLDCYVERFRGKHDLTNSVIAGRATGAVLARAGGPQAMGFGCRGFAAFSVAIDHFMAPSY